MENGGLVVKCHAFSEPYSIVIVYKVEMSPSKDYI